MSIIIVASIWLFLSIMCVLIIRNLLKKVEIYEEDIQYKDEYIKKIAEFIDQSDAQLKDPIIRSAFESDDQIGDFFKRMNNMVITLDVYEKKYNETIKPEENKK